VLSLVKLGVIGTATLASAPSCDTAIVLRPENHPTIIVPLGELFVVQTGSVTFLRALPCYIVAAAIAIAVAIRDLNCW